MNTSQKKVAIGAASGVACMVLAVHLLSNLALPNPLAVTLAERLAYALQWDVLALLPLLIGVITVGNSRFLSDAIDPTQHAESLTMEVDGRVVDNTLQQTVLFIPATLATATLVPPEYLNVVAAAALMFLVARVLFWIGYRIHPLYRAFGMAATGYLNLGLIAYCLITFFF